jgi:hypothetical protein
MFQKQIAIHHYQNSLKLNFLGICKGVMLAHFLASENALKKKSQPGIGCTDLDIE